MITQRVMHVIVWEITKDSRLTSRKLKAFIAVATVNVHESTVTRTLNVSGVYGVCNRVAKSHYFPKRTLLLSSNFLV